MDMQTAIEMWRQGNDSGNGYAVGSDSDSPAEAAEAEGWMVLDRDAEGRVLCDTGTGLALVCDSHGPWAVDMDPEALGLLPIDSRIEAGEGEGYDTGRILGYTDNGYVIAWDSGVRTEHPRLSVSAL